MEVTGELQELAPHGSPLLWFGFALEAALGFFMGALSLSGNGAGVALGIFFIVAGATFPACFWLWLANTRLLIGPRVVGYQNLFGQRRTWPVSAIARVVQVTIVYYAPRSGHERKPALLLVGSDGRCLLKVRTARWNSEAIDAFAAATGCTVEYLDSYGTDEAAREVPGSVGWMYAHPRMSLWVGFGALLALGALFEVWMLTGR